MTQTKNSDGYVIARTQSEYERLRIQAKVWQGLTERVLAAAGLGPGMSALDAGCGPGEVMRLMGRMVGPEGQVTGVDIDPEVGAYGVTRLREEEGRDFTFHAANLLEGGPVPGAPFDLVYCRFVLMHMADPVAMVRRLAGLLKPGGTLVVMDYIMDTMRAAPDDPVLERGMQVLNETLVAGGRWIDAGLRLGEWFDAAGLPMPMGTDMQGRYEVGSSNSMLAMAVKGFAPMGIELGVLDAEEAAALPDEIRAVLAQGKHCLHWPTVTAAWTRVG